MKMSEWTERRKIAEKGKINRIIETKAGRGDLWVGETFSADPRGRKHAN